MCFYESNREKKERIITHLCLGNSINIAIKEYTTRYPGDKIIINIRGKYKKILQIEYKEYCVEPLENYWTNSQVIFEVTDGIITDIKMHG
jgi:hypothetical protein